MCCGDDSKGLRTHFGLWPFDLIIVEVLKKEGVRPEGVEETAEEKQEKVTSENDGMKGDAVGGEMSGVLQQEKKGSTSVALQVIKSLRHYIRIQFNDPRIFASSTDGNASSTTHTGNDTAVVPSDTLLTSSPNTTTTNTANTSSTGGDLYTYSLRVSNEWSLYQLKEEISKTLMDPLLCFHVQGPSYKDETKTLLQLGLCNMSILHLVMGKGCQPGKYPCPPSTLYTSISAAPVYAYV